MVRRKNQQRPSREDRRKLTRMAVEGRQDAFLAAYAVMGIIHRAAKAAGVSRFSHNEWMGDPAYVEKFRLAQQEAAENIEAEARRRAIHGLSRMKFYKGKPIIDPRTGQPYIEHEYSDRLLELLLKAYIPERFTERQEIQTTEGPPAEYDPAEVELMRAQAKVVLEMRQRQSRTHESTAAAGPTRSEDPGQPE